MFCIMGMRNCTVEHARERKPDACNQCGFNLEEYNRRISDIRENGLRMVSEGIRGYTVKRRVNDA